MLPPHRARTDPGPRPRTDPNRSDDGNAKYDRLHEWAAERDDGAEKLLWLDKACSMLRGGTNLQLAPCTRALDLISTSQSPLCTVDQADIDASLVSPTALPWVFRSRAVPLSSAADKAPGSYPCGDRLDSPFFCPDVSTYSCWLGPLTQAACGVLWCVFALPLGDCACCPRFALSASRHPETHSAPRFAPWAGAVRLRSHGRRA